MTTVDDPWGRLRVRAGLASGWPTLHCYGPDEAAISAARDRLEALLGPLPQTDTIEPWDPTDPDDPWELRIDLPRLSDASWRQICAVELPDTVSIELEPGLHPAVRACDDFGLRLSDPLGPALAWSSPDHGALHLDLARPRTRDAEVERLERDLALAVQAVDGTLQLQSNHGPDTVQPVVHRSTGRFGVQLALDAPPEQREAIVHAVRSVVAAREHDDVPLAPDLVWSPTAVGFELIAWFLSPPAAALPGDQPVPEGVSPSRRHLDALDALDVEVELQVVPTGAEWHDVVAAAVSAMIGARDSALSGAIPRWVELDGPQFCPVWRGRATELPDGDGIVDLPHVRAVRVVPVPWPDDWLTLVPSWHWGDQRCAVRCRDALLDQDRLVRCRPVQPDAVDALVGDLMRVRAEAVVNEGRRAVQVPLPGAVVQADIARTVLDALTDLMHPELGPLVTWGWKDGKPLARLWRTTPA